MQVFHMAVIATMSQSFSEPWDDWPRASGQIESTQSRRLGEWRAEESRTCRDIGVISVGIALVYNIRIIFI